MSKSQAEGIVHIDDERFKVTEWRFAPGAETGWHVHGHDYVVVPLTDGTLGLDNPGGVAQTAALTQGVPYSRRVGVHHNVTNAGPEPLAFLEIEAVADATALRRCEVLERFMAAWNARDLDALMACMAQDCSFNAAVGSEAEGQRVSGREEVRAAYAAVFDSFPEAAWTAGTHRIFGDTGLSEWRFIGTDNAGQHVDVHGCDIFRFVGDLIAFKDTYRKARST